MKVGYRCALCLVARGYNQIIRATEDRDTRLSALQQVIELIGRGFTPDAVPSILGTKRDRLVKEATGNSDPYANLKRGANGQALETFPFVRNWVVNHAEGLDRFHAACRAVSLANIIEYDIPGHDGSFVEHFASLEKEVFDIDDVASFYRLVRSGLRVLYLCDNAGEIAFDRLLVSEFRGLGCRVTVAVKGGAALNDALMEDAVEVGMTGVADEVVSTGTDAIGVNPEDCSEEFLRIFEGAELILSKGMANWETMTEFEAPCPTLFLLRTKCEPVAESLGVPLGRNVAKLVPKGFRL